MTCDDDKRLAEFRKGNQNFLAINGEENLAFLAYGERHLKSAVKRWPEIEFHTTRKLR